MAEIIEIDLKGRVKSTKLAQTRCLLPVYEAIINSIHAIEDAKVKNGEICIKLERKKELEFDNDPYFHPIQSFLISDNGIGFNEVNFTSFKRAHTTHKENRGSKGIGRFLWLKAFNKVSVESDFLENNSHHNRKFDFSIHASGINNHKLNESKKIKNWTTVKLQAFKDEYGQFCPKKPTTIANKIIEHCLIYFLNKNCPQIKLINDNNEEIILNDYFKKNFAEYKIQDNFKVDNYKFNLTILRVYDNDEITSNELHYCAHLREVDTINLKDIEPELRNKIFDNEAEKSYLIVAYLESKYFDEHLNDERTEIAFAKGSLKFDLIKETDLHSELQKVIKRHFSVEIDKSRAEKISYINEFIALKSPQYRPLLKHQELIAEIGLNPLQVNEQDLDIKLYKAYQHIEYASKVQMLALKEELDNSDDEFTVRKDEMQKAIEETNELGKSKLAQYIIHRNLILDLFGKTLNKKANGKYSLEDSIHDIIFPLKTSSDDVDYEKQNLWIIDEKLSFHQYLASDKPLNSSRKEDAEDRPDILIYDNPCVFIEGDLSQNQIVLVEFKRPMRNAYDEEENPFIQIFKYIEKIRANKAIDHNGRPIQITENTPFYIYIICDLTSKIRQYATNYDMLLSPDGAGFFHYHKSYKAYIEIISFNKLYDTAKRRNKVLFDKLGIPAPK